ncbi:Neuronal acetylcholine receptor subunit alpha-2 [Heterocephalus glaber]|uniref:Neuronal acetylcholine receptor subunit alpha-2 n=1 Tax=Heterocephalus glaber TaxID=10181 RepID=G5B9U7_HETGA|nr:Neuronal acetylcholine receptor subunit alpha-2 [Heterocephalus glaber]
MLSFLGLHLQVHIIAGPDCGDDGSELRDTQGKPANGQAVVMRTVHNEVILLLVPNEDRPGEPGASVTCRRIAATMTLTLIERADEKGAAAPRKWKLTQNPDITSLWVPSELIWIPEIILYNKRGLEVTLLTKAHLFSRDTVHWVPLSICKRSCLLPAELQIKSAPRPTTRSRSDSRPEGLVGEHCLTIIISMATTTVRSTSMSPGASSPLATALPYRHPHFLCLIVSCLTMLIFHLLSRCREKIPMCVCMLLSLTDFLLLVTEIILTTSLVTPLIRPHGPMAEAIPGKCEVLLSPCVQKGLEGVHYNAEHL